MGLVVFGGDPEVELLCIPVQRSQRFVHCYWVPFGGRLSALWDRVDGGGGEGEKKKEMRRRKKRNLQKSWSQRKKRWPWLVKDWGFLRYWLWEEEGVLP